MADNPVDLAELAQQVSELHALTFGGPPLPELQTPWVWQQPLPCRAANEYPYIKVEVTAGGGLTVTVFGSYGEPLRRVVWGTRLLLDASGGDGR